MRTGDASNFIFRKRPKKANLLKLATTGLPRGRGRKVTKSTNKRKFGPKQKSRKQILETIDKTFFDSSFDVQRTAHREVNPSKKQAMTCRPPPHYLKDVQKKMKISEQPVVRVGTPMIMPPQPEPQPQPYELVLRQGNIAVCHGCGDPFGKENELYILGRTEFDWYPKISNSTKTFKSSRAGNRYYCLLKRCLLLRRPHLTHITIIHGGVTTVPDNVHAKIKDEFNINVVVNWLY